MIVLLPLPVAPSSATVWPGCATKLTSFSTGAPPEIAERHILELDLALNRGQGERAGLVRHIALGVQNLEDAAGRGATPAPSA